MRCAFRATCSWIRTLILLKVSEFLLCLLIFRFTNKQFNASRKMKYFLFLLLVIFASAVSSLRNWKTSDDGAVRWSNSCDFPAGAYLSSRRIPSEHRCAKYCLLNPMCTHFSHQGNICILKRSLVRLHSMDSFLPFSSCGFVVGRSRRNF